MSDQPDTAINETENQAIEDATQDRDDTVDAHTRTTVTDPDVGVNMITIASPEKRESLMNKGWMTNTLASLKMDSPRVRERMVAGEAHKAYMNSSNVVSRKQTHTVSIRPGVYEHYKGRRYEVLSTATHTETEEELVVYRALYSDSEDDRNRTPLTWVKPYVMFSEFDRIKWKRSGDDEAVERSRFEFIRDKVENEDWMYDAR